MFYPKNLARKGLMHNYSVSTRVCHMAAVAGTTILVPANLCQVTFTYLKIQCLYMKSAGTWALIQYKDVVLPV